MVLCGNRSAVREAYKPDTGNRCHYDSGFFTLETGSGSAGILVDGGYSGRHFLPFPVMMERDIRTGEIMTEHRTGLEDYFILKDGKYLRYGYTTGSCASAAAKAAVHMLLTGEKTEEVALMTPKGILLHLAVEEIHMQSGRVSCAVRKDGGDDPDVTDGVLVFAEVWRAKEPGVHLSGGIGVGRVTRPGLSVPVGEPAINPVPRKMITQAVMEICHNQNYADGIHVKISIPEGVNLASRTFNPRLGIEGGISVLGTSGIVVPMSEDALIASIRLEMKMLKKAGAHYLVITPGNYGEIFSREQMNIDLTYSMKCSNYVGETLDMAAQLGLEGILFIAHIGKFIKVSGGIMNTHSRNADCRAELMAAQALRAGADQDTLSAILDSITTEESVQILKKSGLLGATMEETARRVQFYLDHRTGGRIMTGAILFSSVEGRLADTATVPELMKRIGKSRNNDETV